MMSEERLQENIRNIVAEEFRAQEEERRQEESSDEEETEAPEVPEEEPVSPKIAM